MVKYKESDLYLPVKNWLEINGWEVYSEVTGGYTGSSRADIVGIHEDGKTTCVIELKTSLTDKLLEQANNWVGTANYVYVAVPLKKNNNLSIVKREFMDKRKIGLLLVDLENFYHKMNVLEEYDYLEEEYNKMNTNLTNKYGYFRENYFGVEESFPIAKYNRKIIQNFWKPKVHELMRLGTGGVKSGGQITPYKVTMLKIKKYLYIRYKRDVANMLHPDEQGWATIEDICDSCETHYSNPKPSVRQALINFEYKSVEKIKKNNRIYFRLTKEEMLKYINNSELII